MVGTAPQALMFHIANNRYPRSFLADPRWLAGYLMHLCGRARQAGFDALFTMSWLNENPRWLAAFPPSWADRRGPALRWVRTWGAGATCSARQTVAPLAAADLRRNWELKYSIRTTWAWLDEIEQFARRAHRVIRGR